MLGFLMNRWALGALAGLVMLGFVYFKGYSHGKDVVQKKWDADKVAQERVIQKWKDKVRETEQTMQAKVNQIQKEKLNDFQIVSVRYHALLNSLRDRPTGRADPVPHDSGNDMGCTGAGLAGPDAEFLAGYAADAAKLQSAYDACKAAYELVQKQNHAAD